MFVIPTRGRHSFRMLRNDLKILRVHNTRRDHLLYHVFFSLHWLRPEWNSPNNYPLEGDVQNDSLPMKKARYRLNKKKRFDE